MKLIDFLVQTLEISKSEAKRLINQGGVIVNDIKPNNFDFELKNRDKLKVRHKLFIIHYEK